MIQLPSGRKIGEGEPTFVIAEIGSNWKTLDDCLLSIRCAKACGADAVKFQLYDYAALYGVDGSKKDPLNGWTEAAKVDRFTLSHSWLPRLKEESDRAGIEFMCSAFSPELIEVLDPFIHIHKVASAEMTHVRILEKLRKIGKPVLLSTGASGLMDIKEALRILGPTPAIPMYCVAAYPAQVVNLDLISVMRSELKHAIGYSDHSIDALVIPYQAAQLGAVAIEKHVTFVECETPDSPHSLDERAFKLMVSRLRGNPVSAIGPTKEEEPMILRHNRRLIATRDIKPGDTLIEGENFGIYRSLKEDTKALSPFAIDRVMGRNAKNAIKTGEGIGPNDIA